MSTNNIPYSWLKQEVIDTIPQFERTLCLLSEKAQKGYIHQHPCQTDTNVAYELLKEKGKSFNKNEVPKGVFWNLICNDSMTHRTFSELVAVDCMGMTKMLKAFLQNIKEGDLLLPLILLRCIIEHTANLNKIIGAINNTEFASYKEANDYLETLENTVFAKCLGTRVDWQFISTTDSFADNTKIKYIPDTEKTDLSATNILSSVDLLGKKIEGARVLYEILCEFAHPNIGNLMLIEKAEMEQDMMGVNWIKKHFYMYFPSRFCTSFQSLNKFIFETSAKIINHYETLVLSADDKKKIILKVTQIVVKQRVAPYRNLIDPYWLCPCGSGNKIKFCCLS